MPDKAIVKDRLLRVDEVSKRLNCNARTVYRIIADGDLAALKVRGSLRVTESTLQHYIEKQILKFQQENGICDFFDYD